MNDEQKNVNTNNTNSNNTNRTNPFFILNKIDLGDYTKSKLNFTYLSWSDAWTILKKNYPDATWKVYSRTIKREKTETLTDDTTGKTTTITTIESEQEIPYFSDGNTCFVRVGVTIEGIEYIEIYPVMDCKNKSIKERTVTMMDVNNAIQRAFVKCVARHGLGLYIYRREDFPEDLELEVPEISNSDDFASVQKDVISLILSFDKAPEKKANEMTRYIKELFPNKRIGETTEEDLENLKLARNRLSELLSSE